jgi:hypothetical protein
MVSGSGHEIYLYQPQVVVRSIAAVVNSAKRHTRLPPTESRMGSSQRSYCCYPASGAVLEVQQSFGWNVSRMVAVCDRARAERRHSFAFRLVSLRVPVLLLLPFAYMPSPLPRQV